MAVCNCTPDSFYPQSRYFTECELSKFCEDAVRAGVSIIDIGGESSRPGADSVSADEEWRRVEKVIHWFNMHVPDISLSIDTVKTEVARKALDTGVSIINDISAGKSSGEKMFRLCKEYNSEIILMHMKGIPKTMQIEPDYTDVVSEIHDFFKEIYCKISSYGIPKSKIILDPGIGFGKNADHNITIIKNLQKFKDLECPLLIGASMKRIIGDITHADVNDRLAGTIGIHLAAIQNGADIVRVHNPLAMRHAFECFQQCMVYNTDIVK